MCVLIGEGGVGKDCVVRRLLELEPRVTRVLQYTTRPLREGERDGMEYRFITEEHLREQQRLGKVLLIEEFPPKGVYALLDDEQVDERSNDAYVVVTTLEGAHRLRERYGADQVSVVHLCTSDDTRLLRMFSRAMAGDHDFHEVCRRFVADDEDFSPERFAKLGLMDDRVENTCVDDSVDELLHRLGLRRQRRRQQTALPTATVERFMKSRDGRDEDDDVVGRFSADVQRGGRRGEDRRTCGGTFTANDDRRARSCAGRGNRRSYGPDGRRRAYSSSGRRQDDRRRPK